MSASIENEVFRAAHDEAAEQLRAEVLRWLVDKPAFLRWLEDEDEVGTDTDEGSLE